MVAIGKSKSHNSNCPTVKDIHHSSGGVLGLKRTPSTAKKKMLTNADIKIIINDNLCKADTALEFSLSTSAFSLRNLPDVIWRLRKDLHRSILLTDFQFTIVEIHYRSFFRVRGF